MGAPEELAARLVAQGVGTAVGTDVFHNQTPATPDTAIVVRPTGGLDSLGTFGDVDNVQRPTVQILSRADKTSTAIANARAARAALHGFSGTLSGTEYRWIKCMESEPRKLSDDPERRARFVFNFQIWKEASA